MAERKRRSRTQNETLLSQENAAFAFIDYQPEQVETVGSIGHEELILNASALARTAQAYAMPVVLTTVGVALGVNRSTEAVLRELLPGVEEIDRTSLNAWEDPNFRKAIEQTGRKKIILGGLWTEVCVAFPALDMIREGYEVHVVSDAIGGLTPDAHERAMQRMIQAGARPVTTIAVACEIQRDWGRPDSDNLRRLMRWYFPVLQRLGVQAAAASGAEERLQ